MPGCVLNDLLYDLLFFGEDWGRHPSTAQFLGRELMAHYRLHWINSIGLREPSLSRADLDRVLGKLRRARATPGAAPAEQSEAVSELPPELLSPWVLPLHRYAAVRALNRRLFQRQLNRWAHLRPGNYLTITANPASWYLLDELQAHTRVYYCADKYAHIAGLNPELVERFERQLLQRVDLVVASSRPLCDDLRQQHDNVHYLPHGVDVERFGQALTSTAPRPDLPAGPIVGFIGLLGEHIDLSLITGVADRLPDAQVLCVGPTEEGIELPQRPNLHFPGPVVQSSLPDWLAHMDLCLLPYAASERNRYANPTKVREYLAAGREVIATPQPGLDDIPGAVVSAPIADFVATVAERLPAASASTATQRQTIAAAVASDSWQARAATLHRLLIEAGQDS